jgi:hypothetical protein
MIDIRRYEMVVRLKAFGTAHSELFPASTGGGKLFAVLGTRVDELESRVVAQAAGKNATSHGISTKNAARDQLCRLLTTLMRTVKIVIAGTPGVKNRFRLPKSRGDQRLVATARAIVQDATPFADAIVTHNLPSTFLADVTAAIDAVEAAIQAHATAKESRIAARAAIDESLAAALAIADQLDTVVANQCGSDAPILAEWRAARRVSRVSVPHRSPKQAADPTTAPPAPAPKAA